MAITNVRFVERPILWLRQSSSIWENAVIFAFRNFPLANSHPHSQHAAETAEAAGARGRFWEMHDLLFENQDALEDEDLAQYASALDLDGQTAY